MVDVILRGGTIYDGSNRPPFKADVAIKNNKIVQIANHIHSPAKEIKDIQGLWACPGFVDIHTHYDAEVEINPSLDESVRHGISSIVMGNCSLSLNIGSPEINAQLFERVETMPELIRIWKKNAKTWPSTKQYLNHINQLKLGPNVAHLTGHSAIRAQVMGLERSLTEPATKKEIKSMVALANEALEAGSIGISIDMVHWHRVCGEYSGKSLPSHHASYEEYAALASVCRHRDAVFQLTPNPKQLWSSIFNIIKLSYGVVRAPLRCTILSAMDMTINPKVWKDATRFATVCNRLLGANIRFQTIPVPFTIYGDGPITPLFEEFESGYLLNNLIDQKDRLALWQKPNFKQKFKEDWLNIKGRTFAGNFKDIIMIASPQNSWHNKSAQQIADEFNQDPLDFFIECLSKYDTDIRWKHTGANTRCHIRQKLMKHPYVLPGFSDAGAHCRNLAYFDSALSLIKQSYQTGFMPIEQAISRVTSEPAKWFNLNTGKLEVGAKADITILEPKRLSAPIVEPVLEQLDICASSQRMVKRDKTSPVHSVIINGQEVACNGQPKNVNVKTGVVLTSNIPWMTTKQSYQRYRDRINDSQIDHPLTDYWDIFILKHQQKWNVFLHCTAFIIMYAIALFAIGLNQYWLILLMPLSQMTGLIGHYFFESSSVDQRDTVFSWRAFICLHKLMYYVATGQYVKQINRVKAIVN